VSNLDKYTDQQLAQGRAYFSKEDALTALGIGAEAFTAAASRLKKKHRLSSPHRGFYLILRPEDRLSGAPDPVRWIDPYMKYLELDYRISLLRAAAFHGSSHQASMVFQIVVPKQIRAFELGRHRVQFVYQDPAAFASSNLPEFLDKIKSAEGFAKVAGVELLLFDSARYFHKVGGINGLAQIAHDVGGNAEPGKLGKLAQRYENSAVRRLGYLLEHFGHERQAKALARFATKAKSMKPLDPSSKAVLPELAESYEHNSRWMLTINEPVEIDT
jgi:predicted transcriptional regulator of viral defense system